MNKPETGGTQDIFHAATNIVPLPMIEKAAGIYMWDEQGNEYIDASSGPVVSNIGHGNEHVATAMFEQARTMDFAYSRVSRHRPNQELSARIARLAGPGYERICLASGGSEAMEIGIKFLRQYAMATGNPGKRKIITCMPSYHGGTVATLAMSGDESLLPFLDGFAVISEKVPAPFSYRLPRGHTIESYAMECADAVEHKILEQGADSVLAFVLEPIGGLATGCLVPPESYFARVREICSRHGVYLVFDEILCGTGRTGKFLAAQHWPGAMPDIVVLAKGLGSGYSPLAAVLVPARMSDELAQLCGFDFSHTYNANPISCATGLAVLDEYDRLDLVGNAAETGAYLREKLLELKNSCPIIGDIRGRGLLMAVEMVTDQDARTKFPPGFQASDKVRIHGLNNGLIIYSRAIANGNYGEWFIIAPPLIISERECDKLVRRLDATLKDLIVEFDAANLYDPTVDPGIER